MLFIAKVNIWWSYSGRWLSFCFFDLQNMVTSSFCKFDIGILFACCFALVFCMICQGKLFIDL